MVDRGLKTEYWEDSPPTVGGGWDWTTEKAADSCLSHSHLGVVPDPRLEAECPDSSDCQEIVSVWCHGGLVSTKLTSAAED